jgi:hypothetical protein
MAVIIRNEHFDVDMMEKLLRHEGVCERDKAFLKRYKKRAKDGNRVEVEYKYGKNWRERGEGRLYPDTPSLVSSNMSRSLRNALGARYYWDIDIENAQPSILREFCKEQEWACSVLEEFIQKRTSILETMMTTLNFTRDEAKQECIQVLFGGYSDKHPILLKLFTELSRIKKACVGHFPDLCAHLKKIKDTNIEGSLLANVLQDKERQILLHFDAYLASQGRSFDVLIHDGGLIKKKEGEIELPQQLLDGCVAYLKEKTGFDLRLSVKEMTHTFEFVDKQPEINSKLATVIREFEKTHFYMKSTSQVCEEDPEGGISMSWTLLKAFEALGNTYNYFDSTGCVQPIKSWVSSPNRRTYDRLGFYPGKGPANIYNLYRGPEASFLPVPVLQDTRFAAVDAFKELIAVLLNRNQEHIDHLTKWVAHIFQKPAERAGTAIVFTGDMGLGKDMFWALIGTLLGSKLAYSTLNYEKHIFGDFNPNLAGRLLIRMEEVNADAMRKHDDVLKGLITGTTVTINQKNEKPYDIEHYARIVMTSNHESPIKIAPTDRRFNVFHCGDEKRGDVEWFKKTYAAMMAGRRAIYDYLMAVDLKGFNVTQILKTEYHQLLAEQERPAQQDWLTAVAMDPNYNKVDRTGSELCADYNTWCRETGNVPCHAKWFMRKLTPMISRGHIQKTTQQLGIQRYTIKSMVATEDQG